MCWSSEAVSIAWAAAATAGDVAVVSVNGADEALDAGFDESDDPFAFDFSVTHPARTMAARRPQLRREGSTGEEIGV